MRHRMQKNSSFGCARSHRQAMLRGMIKSLVEHERIKTTHARAKALRPLMERAITRGKKGGVANLRLLLKNHPCKKTASKIMNTLSPRFKDRAGGYTRIIRLGYRTGDKAPLAYLEFVDYKPRLKVKPPAEKQPATQSKEKPVYTAEENKIRRKKDRKAFAKRKRLRQIQKKSRRIHAKS